MLCVEGCAPAESPIVPTWVCTVPLEKLIVLLPLSGSSKFRYLKGWLAERKLLVPDGRATTGCIQFHFVQD